ncbi:MAG TPA: hypothetical protein ENJ09_12135 [Planctomycetes bacterium]|nr:hypothetical protein [Planctomycetota bacterium]
MKSFPTIAAGASLMLLLCGAIRPMDRSSGAVPDPDPHVVVHGMTISCQTWGWEWGSPGFEAELVRLSDLGVNWVAIHPYASVGAGGNVGSRRHPLDPANPPEHLTSPIERAHDHGFDLFVKPHLAYWGSPFGWRGEIGFEDPAERERFWESYSRWIVDLASVTSEADAFCVGTELDRMLGDEARWRALIARVREVTDAQLTYAANWDRVGDVPFWDALDAIGVQAYFPLVREGEAPTEEALRAGWERTLAPLHELSKRFGKPVVFTEMGFSDSPAAAERPWEDPPRGGKRADELQARCLAVSLAELARHSEWLRGAFLWKWFVGRPHHEDAGFYLDTPHLRAVISAAWRR